MEKIANLDENMKFKGGPNDPIYRRKVLGETSKNPESLLMNLEPKR